MTLPGITMYKRMARARPPTTSSHPTKTSAGCTFDNAPDPQVSLEKPPAHLPATPGNPLLPLRKPPPPVGCVVGLSESSASTEQLEPPALEETPRPIRAPGSVTRVG